MRIVLKTSHQARLDRKKLNHESSCPKCGRRSLGTYSTKHVKDGLFNTKTVRKNNYKCFQCGSKWTTGWR